MSLEGRKFYMGGWRIKLIFLLIVYFAGFATAIYCLAPVPENQGDKSAEQGLVYSAFKSDEFAQSFNSGMHKAVDFSKDAAWRASKYIRQKLDERNDDG
jgi:hypothetical protein